MVGLILSEIHYSDFRGPKNRLDRPSSGHGASFFLDVKRVNLSSPGVERSIELLGCELHYLSSLIGQESPHIQRPAEPMKGSKGAANNCLFIPSRAYLPNGPRNCHRLGSDQIPWGFKERGLMQNAEARIHRSTFLCEPPEDVNVNAECFGPPGLKAPPQCVMGALCCS